MSKPGEISGRLLEWFTASRRDLPWRRTYDPYQVWISEVMLQQTQMDRVVPFFLRWLGRFPDVAAVAESELAELIGYWEGLGYYSRVRTLHQGARQIVDRHGGLLPNRYEELLALPGIGPYTAGAIMSIAFNRDYPAVDGNVKRVLARLDDLTLPSGTKELEECCRQRAGELLPSGRARDFNQALMELGAMLCLPRRPGCSSCPLTHHCLAHQRGCVEMRPVKGKRVPIIPQFRLAAVILWDDRLLIRCRPLEGRWGGLWEFPDFPVGLEEANATREVERLVQEETGCTIRVVEDLGEVVSGFTNHKLTTRAYLCRIDNAALRTGEPSTTDWQWLPATEAFALAYSSAHRKIIKRLLKRC
jgi:A/G-specific adenine glycosylase